MSIIKLLQWDACKIDEIPELQQRKAQLIFADSPFNIGEPYMGFQDSFTDDEFKTFTYDWLKAAASVLSPNGVLVGHGNDNLIEVILGAYRTWFKRVGTVHWSFRFGQCRKTHWITGHATNVILQLKTATELPFNWQDVSETSDRVKYKDKRVANGVNGKRPYFTVWDIPRVVGNAKERRPKCPNQLPEELVSRFVRAYTSTGDLVVDPFLGSGTTAAVCKKLGRDCISCDISDETVKYAQERIDGT